MERILAEAFALIENPGIRVAQCAGDLLQDAGATVDSDIARIPEWLAARALSSAPREFTLFDREGRPAVRYGGDRVHFDPGSSCLNILDSETRELRPAFADDLVRLVQLTDALPEFAAQSTALVCDDVPQEIGDWYRLMLVLWYSAKPVVTGAFSGPSLKTMLALLALESGSEKALREKPRAIFDVCPSAPLNWSEFASQNLIELARAGVPAEIISVPLAGATAPVTLAGAVVQHAAECLSGLVIHQLASSGAPVVWGGAPCIFDMSSGTTPMGSVETAMLNCACAQVGQHLGLPAHGYLVNSDARMLDAQAGLESGTSAALGALAGINMISGAGMLDTLACHSLEKLVIDAECIASAQRLVAGIEPRGDSLATAMFAQTGHAGDFLKLKETRALFRQEQHFPSAVIARGQSVDSDLWTRARNRVDELLATYQRVPLPEERERALLEFAEREGAPHGLRGFPGLAATQASAVTHPETASSTARK
jgi:trimethylamine--corrinoid protein Co-methyltransferase